MVSVLVKRPRDGRRSDWVIRTSSAVVGLLVVLLGIAPMQASFTELLAQGFVFVRSLGGR